MNGIILVEDLIYVPLTFGLDLSKLFNVDYPPDRDRDAEACPYSLPSHGKECTPGTSLASLTGVEMSLFRSGRLSTCTSNSEISRDSSVLFFDGGYFATAHDRPWKVTLDYQKVLYSILVHGQYSMVAVNLYSVLRQQHLLL